jgi:hypothetical protein
MRNRLSHNIRRSLRLSGLLALAVFVGAQTCFAEEAKLRPVIENLGAPVAIAVRPDSGTPQQLFVADRATGRVIQIDGSTAGTSKREITGFPRGAFQPGKPLLGQGIASIHFLDHSRLVAAGGADDGKPFVWLYDLSSEDSNLTAADRKQEVDLDDEAKGTKPANTIRALARSRPNDRVADILLGAAAADDGPSALWKIAVRANTLADTAVNDAVEKDRELGDVVAMTQSAAGYIVLASAKSERTHDQCNLRYLNPIDGEIAMEVPVKLPHVAAIAFSPSSSNLYVASFAAANQGGGVYRLDDAGTSGKPACNAVKIAAVSYPTAIALTPTGSLYVTSIGESFSAGQSSGAVIEISGQF